MVEAVAGKKMGPWRKVGQWMQRRLGKKMPEPEPEPELEGMAKYVAQAKEMFEGVKEKALPYVEGVKEKALPYVEMAKEKVETAKEKVDAMSPTEVMGLIALAVVPLILLGLLLLAFSRKGPKATEAAEEMLLDELPMEELPPLEVEQPPVEEEVPAKAVEEEIPKEETPVVVVREVVKEVVSSAEEKAMEEKEVVLEKVPPVSALAEAPVLAPETAPEPEEKPFEVEEPDEDSESAAATAGVEEIALDDEVPMMPAETKEAEEDLPPVETTSVAQSQGGRPHMEDEYLTFRDGAVVAAAVFDGCGGGKASKVARDTMLNLFKVGVGSDKDALVKALATTEKACIAKARSEKNWPDASTAVVAALVPDASGPRLSLAWIGDSRALLATSTNATFLTRDHNADNPDEEKRVKAEGGKVGRTKAEAEASGKKKALAKFVGSAVAFKTRADNPKRVFPGGITLTRALGGLPLKYTKPLLVNAKPETLDRKLDGSEKFLVLGSDGVFEFLNASQAAAVVDKAVFAKRDPAKALVDAAVSAGAKDNLTAVVLPLA